MGNVYDPKALITLPGRSRFDLSYRNTFTAKMAQLIPIYAKPVVPGDRFKMSLVYQMQLAPMYNPVYDGLTVNFEAFFVPNRILDPQWREFWTGYNEYDQMTPVEVAPLEFHVYNEVENAMLTDADGVYGTGIGKSSLLDFLGYRFSAYESFTGLPVRETSQGGFQGAFKINAYPILGYHRIYDDWYRNERTQQASLYWYYNNFWRNPGASRYIDQTITSDSVYGVLNVPDLLKFHVRNYAKDRFTTALPEPIIGGDVRIPVNDNFYENSMPYDLIGVSELDIDGNSVLSTDPIGGGLNALALGTIQQLKLAYKEYEYRMKDTYNGNRYVESMESHYGVRVPDSTLQRSMYLGSAQDYVNFGEVYQTSGGTGIDDGETGALGDYAGRGGSYGSHFLFDESFYEPGYVYVMFSISPKARYFQGIHRHLVRYDRDDYFSPEFQNIGDDYIENCEIFNVLPIGLTQTDHGVFGYQTRWYDFKSNYDELHGDFADIRMDPEGEALFGGPMMSWTFARFFGSTPTVSSQFSSIPVINRPFISSDERNDNYFVDVYFDIQALRPILTTESF